MSEHKNVKAAIEKVEHPAISLSLTELGIVRDIQVENKDVILTFAFPFPNIPIADQLIGSVEHTINAMGYELKYIVRVMKEDEKKLFLQLEQRAWKGL